MTVWAERIYLLHVLHLTHKKQPILELHSCTNTHTDFVKRGLCIESVTQTPTSKHRHEGRHTHICSPRRVSYNRVLWSSSACWLLMADHHGNQCCVMSSRSPGSVSFFFHSPTERRGDVVEKKKEGFRGAVDVSRSTCTLGPGVLMADVPQM